MGKAYKEKLIKYGETFDSEEKLQHRVNLLEKLIKNAGYRSGKSPFELLHEK